MKVEYWFDPLCPFCWMTSRWILDVADDRHLAIDWRPISLLFKNEMGPDHPFHDRASASRDMLRVVEAARAAGHGDRVGDLYTALGTRIHHDQTLDLDLVEVLDEVGLDPALAAAADDEAFDAVIRSAMADALALTGDDVGTPIIAVEGPDGRVGLFGPVITTLPDHEAGLRLWDGFVAMAETPGFFELKRTRTSPPDMTTVPRP